MSARRLYKALLYCYPAAFRQEYGAQMQLMFADQLGESRRNGIAAQAALWSAAARDALTVAPKEHWNVILQDLRYAIRTTAASPGFAIVAILSLALGIGANTAIFSLWHGLIHSSLPGVRDPGQLVLLTNPNSAGTWHGSTDGDRDWLTYEEFAQLSGHAASFSGLIASQSSLSRYHVRVDNGAPEDARARMVSGNYFDVLGVGAARGRVFTSEDDRTASPIAVISYAYWQRRFGGRPDILGKTLSLQKATLTIAGVAPAGFIGETISQQPDFWIPVSMQPSIITVEDRLHDRPPEKVMWLHAIGRLKPGMTLARAEAESNAIFRAGLESFYGGVASADRRHDLLNQSLKLRTGSGGMSETRGDFSTSLTVLLAAVGVLLLIACANLANLLLARGASRKAEMALRLSLGASRGRLIRQMITESSLLAAAGAVAGLGTAYLLYATLTAMIIRSDSTFRMDFSLNPLVLAFTLGVTLMAVLLFGLLPAWQATGNQVGAGLKEHGRGATGRSRWGRTLVAIQLALSLPLLVGAGLLVRTLYNLQHLDLGYPSARLSMFAIDSQSAGYNSERSSQLFRDVLDQVRRIPGVQAATFSQNGLFTGGNSTDEIVVEGFTPNTRDDKSSQVELVGPRYFSALGIPVILGREIGEEDRAESPRVCLINEAFRKHFFAGRNPVGLHITADGDGHHFTYQVVGVARDAHLSGLRSDVSPRFFIPMTQPLSVAKRASFLLRTSTDPGRILAATRQIVRDTAPAIEIAEVHTMEEQLEPWTTPEKTTAHIALVFGCVALALAAIGLYGVLSYGIARRTGEMAVRIALGAQPGRVISMILRETMAIVIVGLLAGGILAHFASTLITKQLFGVQPQDPVTILIATGLLILVALSAAYLPARRASQQDPMRALRQA